MTVLRQLEDKLARQTKRLPQLPPHITESLYTNAWRLLVVAGVFTVIDLFNAIKVLHTSRILQTNYGWMYDGSNAESLAYLAIIVDLIAIYWIFKAVAPLKDRQKKGWDYIYKTALLLTVSGVIMAFWASDSGQFIWALLSGAAGLYLTFSIRPRFIADRAKPTAK